MEPGTELGGMPVSAPGALSTRTDVQAPMEIPGGDWGDRQEMTAIQQGAPLAGKPAPRRPTPLFAPTQRPNEPITSGVDVGPGVGSAGLGPAGMPNQAPPAAPLTETLRKMADNPVTSERTAALLRVVERLNW